MFAVLNGGWNAHDQEHNHDKQRYIIKLACLVVTDNLRQRQRSDDNHDQDHYHYHYTTSNDISGRGCLLGWPSFEWAWKPMLNLAPFKGV